MPGRSIHAPIGRERELAELATLLGSSVTLPAAALIEGEAGMGKTTLWRAGVALALERGFTVLEAHPVEAETALSFSALADLLDPVVDVVAPALPAPQRDALEAALLLRPPRGTALDRRAVGTATLGAIRTLAADRTVLLAVDDIQWLDAASASALGFALRRLRAEPVAGLFTARTPDDAPARAWAGWLPTRSLPVGPLSLGATHALVFERLGAALPRPHLRRLLALSRGNPYYALELTRAWQAGDLRLAESEPLPPALADLLGSRIATLPVRTRSMLAAAAALSRPTLEVLVSVDGADPLAALQPAVAAGVVALDEDEVRFTHPLLAASAYAGVSATHRRLLHARLASVVGDGEERARHLALGAPGPDAAVAAEVEAAADAAFRRGAPATAADLMADATRLTPIEAVADHRRRSLAEAETRFEAGETERAQSLVEDLVTATPPGPGRAAMLARLARFRHFGEDITGSLTLLRQALAEAGDDPRLHVEIEEGLVWGLLLVRADLVGAEAHARSAVAYAERLGDEAALAETLAAHAMALAMLGRDAREPMDRALALEPATLGLRVLRHPSFALGYLQSDADELVAARATFRELAARAEAHGDDSSLPPIRSHLAVVEALAGELVLAQSLAEDAHQMALQSGQVPSQVAALGRVALILAMGDGAEAARQAARRALELATPGGFDPSDPRPAAARGGELAIWALGHAALSLGDHAGAEQYLGPLCRFLLDVGVAEPGEVRPLGDAIEALAGLGRVAEAAVLSSALGAMAIRTGRPSVVGTAARSRAIVVAAGGDVEAALAHAEEAVAAHRVAGMPLELARSLMVLGTTQRRLRSKRAARDAIEAAIRILEPLGARAWAAAAAAELARVGGHASGGSDLSPSERRAAELVAEGRSNKEIAAQMFVSPKTVEANLSRVYAKLGVASRTELVRRLTDERVHG